LFFSFFHWVDGDFLFCPLKGQVRKAAIAITRDFEQQSTQSGIIKVYQAVIGRKSTQVEKIYLKVF
tara:strand:- start:481 stop:678 length:198 start_codon:yes stop_codon:yes gene_type:complete